MKNFTLILLFASLVANSQTRENNFYDIDIKVQSIPVAKTDILAKQLAALGNTDKEKVRAIFRWITEHIDYNVGFFNKSKKPVPAIYEEPDDSNAALPPLNERVAAKVLYRKIAFCDGYARLFKTLCDHSGIQSEIIFGYARNNYNKKFAVNHTWNAVYFDSSWQLLDVTWASGFITYSDEYIKRYDDFYFLTPPDQFIRDHYPEDLQWTLLNDPPIYREFNQSPFRYSGYLKAGLTSYFPSNGVIDAATGDTVELELSSKKEIRNFYVSSSPLFDTMQQAVKPVMKDDKVSFKYVIPPDAVDWIYVFCNEELALRYKLNRKKSLAVTTSKDQ
jgi:transglutaminase/protease-like cytokinesis protein 3